VNLNMNQLLQMIRCSGNPQAMLMNVLERNGANNPFMQNILGMAKNGNAKGLEQVARNMMKEKGLDFDTEFSKFRNNLHL